MSTSVRLSLFPLLAAPALVACGSGSEHAAGVSGSTPPPILDAGPTADAGPSTECAEGKEGCPCDEPGTVVGCGQVYRISGGYVSCSPGEAICSKDLTWGPCVGDSIAHAVP